MSAGGYVKWRRKPDVGPGLAEIFVLEFEGKPQPALPTRSEIQAATLDRIPFTIAPNSLRDHYERVT